MPTTMTPRARYPVSRVIIARASSEIPPDFARISAPWMRSKRARAATWTEERKIGRAEPDRVEWPSPPA